MPPKKPISSDNSAKVNKSRGIFRKTRKNGEEKIQKPPKSLAKIRSGHKDV